MLQRGLYRVLCLAAPLEKDHARYSSLRLRPGRCRQANIPRGSRHSVSGVGVLLLRGPCVPLRRKSGEVVRTFACAASSSSSISTKLSDDLIMVAPSIFRAWKVDDFSEESLRTAFDALDTDNVGELRVEVLLFETQQAIIGAGVPERTAELIIDALRCSVDRPLFPRRTVTFDEFSSRVVDLARQHRITETVANKTRFGGRNRRDRRHLMRHSLFRVLKLSKFDSAELRSAFDRADEDKSGYLELDDIRSMIMKTDMSLDEPQVKAATDALMERLGKRSDGKLSLNEFSGGMRALANERDPRVWPVAAMMLMSGLSWGMLSPALPLLGLSLGLTQVQYGFAVSSLSFARLSSGIPAALSVDRYGRRPVTICALLIQGVCMLAMGFSGSLSHLIAARVGLGAGTCLHTTGAKMTVLDMSTPLNRARMLATTQTAFSVGKVAGPAVGGFAIATLGLVPTICCMGCLLFSNALYAYFNISETLSALNRPKLSDTSTTQHLLSQWRALSTPEIRHLVMVNAVFEFAHGGTTATLLPLMLVSDMALSPAQIGGLLTLQAAVAVVGATPAASLVDRFGPRQVLVPGLTAIAVAMAAFPHAKCIEGVGAVLALWAAGATVFVSAPEVLATSYVPPEARAQMLALMRMSSDLGLCFGAASIGAFGTLLGISSSLTIQGTGVILSVTAGWVLIAQLRKWI